MKIERYKKTTKDRYKIYLDDGRELLLYEDVILKFELLLKKEILEKDIMGIELFNQECDVYHVALELNHKYNLGIDCIRVAACQDVHDEGDENYRMCKIDRVLQELRENDFKDAAVFIEKKLE